MRHRKNRKAQRPITPNHATARKMLTNIVLELGSYVIMDGSTMETDPMTNNWHPQTTVARMIRISMIQVPQPCFDGRPGLLTGHCRDFARLVFWVPP